MLDLDRVDLRSLAEALEDHSPETMWWWFKDALLDFQGLRQVWFAFHDARMERRAIEWLADRGLVDRGVAEREVRAREDPQLPELASGLDPVEIAEAVAGELRALYGRRIRRVLLFGSWARGDAHPESDIDLLVVLDRSSRPGRNCGGWMRSCGGTPIETT
jgi:Nucleotidyltransferase domain